MRRSSPLITAVALVLVLSALAAGCGGSSQSNKPGLVTSWGTDGVVKLVGFEVKQTLEDGSGRIFAVGDHGGFAQVVRLLPNGSLDPSFGKNGRVRWPFQPFQGRFPSGLDNLGWDGATLLPDGRIALVGTNTFGDIYGAGNDESTLVVSEIDQSGGVVKAFGQNGYFTADKRLYRCPRTALSKVYEACQRHLVALAREKTTCTRGPEGLAVQGEKIVISATRFCKEFEPHHIVVLRLNANGTLDRSFGKKGEVTFGTASITDDAPLLALPNGRLVVAGTTPKGGMVRLIKLLPNGAIDRRFGNKGVSSTRVASDSREIQRIDALLQGRHGKINLTGATDDGPFLLRFYSTGDPYCFWEGSPWVAFAECSNYENFGGAFGSWPVFAQLGNGELAGAGNLLERVMTDGSVDYLYPPQRVYGAGELVTTGIIAASDGTVLVTLLNPQSSSTETVFLARYR